MTVTTDVPAIGRVSAVDVMRRRLSGDYVVDEWSYDSDLVDLLDPISGLRWRVQIDGEHRIPSSGPVLLVANRRVGMEEPLVLARAVRRSTGRRVRFVGIPDIPPLGPALRRIGGAVARPEELAALFRAGHVVTLPLSRRWKAKRFAGRLAPEVLVPALDHAVPVIPVALVGGEWFGRWKVVVGAPIDHPVARGPLALAELAESVHDGVQALLDEANPPRSVFG